MNIQNTGAGHKKTNSLDNSFLEKKKLLQQNSKLLQYQREIIQESLDFVLHRNCEAWKISDVKYMKLLNYYLEQRAKINHQLRICEKKNMLHEIQKLYSSMQQAKKNILSVRALLVRALARTVSTYARDCDALCMRHEANTYTNAS